MCFKKFYRNDVKHWCIKYLGEVNRQSTIWEVQERQRPQEGESICWEFHCEAGEPTAHIEPKSKKNILDKNLRILKVKYSRERRLSEPPYLFYMIYLRCSVAGVNIRIASLIVWCLTGLLLFRDCFRSCSQRKTDLINFQGSLWRSAVFLYRVYHQAPHASNEKY